MSPHSDSPDATNWPTQHVYTFWYSQVLLCHVLATHYGCQCCEIQPSSLCLNWRPVFLKVLLAWLDVIFPSSSLLSSSPSMSVPSWSSSTWDKNTILVVKIFRKNVSQRLFGSFFPFNHVEAVKRCSAAGKPCTTCVHGLPGQCPEGDQNG